MTKVQYSFPGCISFLENTRKKFSLILVIVVVLESRTICFDFLSHWQTKWREILLANHRERQCKLSCSEITFVSHPDTASFGANKTYLPATYSLKIISLNVFIFVFVVNDRIFVCFFHCLTNKILAVIFFLSFLLRFHLLTSVDRWIYRRQRRRERTDETLESSYDEKQVGKMFFINNTVEPPLGVQPWGTGKWPLNRGSSLISIIFGGDIALFLIKHATGEALLVHNRSSPISDFIFLHCNLKMIPN